MPPTQIIAIRLNWVTSFFALLILLVFALHSINGENANVDYTNGKAWVAQTFTWLYIGARRASLHP